MKKVENSKCKCGKPFRMGWNGTEDGCDECAHTVRDEHGYAWGPDEKYHDYQDVGSDKAYRVTRRQALYPKAG
jgi:hypothetical protein